MAGRSKGTFARTAGVAVVVCSMGCAPTDLSTHTATSTVLEAVSMSLSPAGAGELVSDPTASRGSAVEIRSAATASKTVFTPTSQRLIVRAKGQSCDGEPVIDVAVDGHSVGTQTVSAAWNDYPLAANIPSGSHTIAVTFADADRPASCTRSLSLDNVRIVPSATIKAAPPALGAPALFVGDYSTGDFSQWDIVQNKFYNGPGVGYTPTYAAAVVDDPAKGSAARFEVRAGDYPGFPSGDRSEVQSNRVDSEGQTRWYAFSTKFEPGFPQNHADLGWGVVNQWHDSGAGSAPLGFVVNGQNGQLSLIAERMAAPGSYLGKVVLWQTPLDVGAWHDFKMEVTWSSSDTIGSVRLWHDGIAQTLTNGNTTYNVRTLIPGGGGVYYKEGYYRQRNIAATGAVDHAEFRAGATESEL